MVDIVDDGGLVDIVVDGILALLAREMKLYAGRFVKDS